ncbi:hypothetical protein VN12_10825 [Pirellula sp. SH-Sr6A]|nr:hypothetical protein VN12_10825 [Pirellula sp. SH-Sr6A]
MGEQVWDFVAERHVERSKHLAAMLDDGFADAWSSSQFRFGGPCERSHADESEVVKQIRVSDIQSLIGVVTWRVAPVFDVYGCLPTEKLRSACRKHGSL